MVEYNKVNARLSDSQLIKLKSVVKSQTRVTLKMNIKMFNANNLPHKLLLTTRHTKKRKLRNALENNMSTDIKLSKTQKAKIIQSGGFLGSLLGKIAGPIMKVAVSLTKYFLASLGITAAASTIEAGIKKTIHGSGTTTIIISNEEINDILKIFLKIFEDSNILLKVITKTIENETKKQKGGFWGILLGTLGSSLLGKLLTGKGIVRAGYRN